MVKHKTLIKTQFITNPDGREGVNNILLSVASVDLVDMGIDDERAPDTNAVDLVEKCTSGENTAGDNVCENVEEV